ncbi:hypothetical protein [Nocardia cerradoensis]|uniref:Uncharacterized protein n=1 Tax=Nocardia cerradoensis TaxID=85688 RepID=A0A231GU04_9NOCA|nr:hypothetical protein [Nocardia cerradoensis]NKY43572.1 hypothetical protein [Nocardia cerradoensis]OXR40058.1 hypothetical protein B7C42_07862 [Nocardia cerradoensis]
MSDHVQLQPPDYHRCLDTVFQSPVACRALLQRLAEMTEGDIRARWSPWMGQQPPPYGPRVWDHVPAAVQLAMLQADYDSVRESANHQYRELAAALEIPPMQYSYVELSHCLRTLLDQQRQRISELEAGTAAGPDPRDRP